MLKILDAYRTAETTNDLAKEVANYLKNRLSCQAVSIFMYEQSSNRLNLLQTTSGKNKENETFSFGVNSPIFQMFEDKKDSIISSGSLLSEYPDVDIIFEDIVSLKGVVYSTIFDSRNNPIGVIRAINKLDHLKQSTEFVSRDLEEMISTANILGSALTARFANSKIISFLDSVTHELVAPIAGIKSISKFLIGYLSKNYEESIEVAKDRINNNIKNILKESEQLILLIENLTMYSRSGRMDKRDIEFRDTLLYADVIRDVIKKLRTLPKLSAFNYEKIIIPDYHEWPMVRVDRNMMAQVFTNILHNSIKYSNPDSNEFLITIYHKMNRGGGFQIFIEDNGIGIDPSKANEIFHPGIRGQNAKAVFPTSTGIGLSTVKNLLNLHDITISVYKLNSPTTFRINIPSKLVVRRYT